MNTRRDEILAVLLAFAGEHGGNSPTLRGLWREYQRRGKRRMAWGVFLKHMYLLEKEGRIVRRHGVIMIRDAPWLTSAQRAAAGQKNGK